MADPITQWTQAMFPRSKRRRRHHHHEEWVWLIIFWVQLLRVAVWLAGVLAICIALVFYGLGLLVAGGWAALAAGNADRKLQRERTAAISPSPPRGPCYRCGQPLAVHTAYGSQLACPAPPPDSLADHDDTHGLVVDYRQKDYGPVAPIIRYGPEVTAPQPEEPPAPRPPRPRKWTW